ncbi:MAG TPA: alkaline phosphatase family protein [Thermoclostridium sp.]
MNMSIKNGQFEGNKIIKPDYDNCILNITSSILKYFGVRTGYSTIGLIDKALQKGYKNVALMVFDGMSVDILEKHLPCTSFLRSNMKQQITSVYPCTTTAAMTAYYSGLSPNEHGWLGWSLYFKEFSAIIDTFTNQESFTKNSFGKHAAFTLMPYRTVFQLIDEANSAVKSYAIIPENISFPDHPNINVRVKSAENVFDSVKFVAKEPGSKFIMSYWYEPDATMHEEGCYINDVKFIMQTIDRLALKMHKELNDTLVIISADHGHLDITDEVYINDIPELDECLVMPPSIEPRAASLFVKPGMEKIFEERFNKYFKDDFILIPKEMVLGSGMFGRGITHKKVTDFIGNYLACGISNKLLRYRTLTAGEQKGYKGHHAGLTREEMVVPLIILE